LRSAAKYPPPGYHDPDDIRLVQIIKNSDRPMSHSLNILGVPFDGTVLGRKGAAGGPSGIREAMAGFSNYNVELARGLEEAKVFDLGDLVFDNAEVGRVHSEVEEEVAADVQEDSLLVVLGGDNSISLPALAACSKRIGRLGLIVVDSHLDLRGKIGGRPTSGSSYGLAIEEGLVDPRNVVEIGVHGFLNSRHYVEKAKRLGITVVPAAEVSAKGPKAISRNAYGIASKGVEAVYLSIDMDAVDLAQVAGVSAPSAGGMWARNLFTLAFEIARNGATKCADIVELAPSLDPSGRSQRVAAAALTYIIAGFGARSNQKA
jgi:formimidoylglutamase